MKRVVRLIIGAPEYSAATNALLVEALKRQRMVFVPDEEQFRGDRFKDDKKTMWAIRSTYQEEEVRANPDEIARAGLEWAADIDYYYQLDKEWE